MSSRFRLLGSSLGVGWKRGQKGDPAVAGKVLEVYRVEDACGSDPGGAGAQDILVDCRG